MKIRLSPMLATGARTMVPTLVLFSVFLLVVGHDVPGGGFAGGLLVSTALLLMFLAFGQRGLRRVLPIEPEVVLGAGLGLAMLAGLVGLLLEGAFLAYIFSSFEAPLIGEIKISSLLLFDLGVYTLVIGVVEMAIQKLGGDAA